MFWNKIASKDISVVVQGGYDPTLTPICLKSIRKVLPKAEIILSTWKNSNITSSEYDKLVLSDDPGAVPFIIDNDKPNNINRLIRSTVAGLNKASCKYVLKIRSDMMLSNKKFLNYFNKYKKRNNYSIFKQRILCNDIYSLQFEIRNDRKIWLPFHISDWWYFGYSEDLKELYSCSEVKEPDFSSYFAITDDLIAGRTRRMSTEQYITSSCAKKNFKQISFDNIKDVNSENVKQSNDFIIGNFVPLSDKLSGIKINKDDYKFYNRVIANPIVKNGLYYFNIWKKKYKEI